MQTAAPVSGMPEPFSKCGCSRGPLPPPHRWGGGKFSDCQFRVMLFLAVLSNIL